MNRVHALVVLFNQWLFSWGKLKQIDKQHFKFWTFYGELFIPSSKTGKRLAQPNQCQMICRLELIESVTKFNLQGSAKTLKGSVLVMSESGLFLLQMMWLCWLHQTVISIFLWSISELSVMGINTSKCVTMILSRKRLECLLWVEGWNSWPSCLKWKSSSNFFKVLFTNEGKCSGESYGQLAEASAVMWVV